MSCKTQKQFKIEQWDNIDSFGDLLLLTLDNMPLVSSTILTPRASGIGPAAPESYWLTGNGLRLPGSLWKLNEFVPLQNIQLRFQAAWKALNEERSTIIARLPTSFGEVSWTNHKTRRERAVTQILFDLLAFLLTSGHTAAASAVCESTRKVDRSTFQSRNHNIAIGEYPSNARLECRKNMFQLEEVDDLTYHPEWLIDRIMTHGGFWAGVLVNSSLKEGYNEPTASFAAEQKSKASIMRDFFDEGNESAKRAASRVNNNETYEFMKSEMREIVDLVSKMVPGLSRYFAEGSSSDAPASPLAMSLVAIYQLIGLVYLVLTTYPTTVEYFRVAVSRAYMMQYCMYMFVLDRIGLYRDQHLKGQKAIFDLEGSTDGSVLVLTPFDLSLETVPLPSLRFLSISWAVESVKRVGRWTPFEVLRPRKMVKGMWPLGIFPGGRYHLG